METIENIAIRNLEIGNVFEEDELITDVWRGGMRTIRREPDTMEIRWFSYDWVPNGEVVSLNNNGYGELSQEDKKYKISKRNLVEAGLW